MNFVTRKLPLLLFVHLLPISSLGLAQDGGRFESPLELRVFLRDPTSRRRQLIGTTPTKEGTGIPIPPEGSWYIEPVAGRTSLRDLIAEIRRHAAPGLLLSGHHAAELIPTIANLPLKRLCVVDAGISDVSLESIGKIGSMEELAIEGCRGVRGAGIKYLTGLRKLSWLSLVSTGVSDGGLRYIAQLHNLRFLDLSSTRIEGSGLRFVATLPSLRELSLGGCWALTNRGVKELRLSPSLRSLNLSGTSVTDSGVAFLADIPTLEVLQLSNTRITDAGLKFLSGLRITDLDLTYCQSITDTGLLESISKLESIERLSLRFIRSITDMGSSSLFGIEGLRLLDLSGTNISDAGLERVPLAESLECLRVSYCNSLTDNALRYIASSKSLTSLHLSGTAISDHGVSLLRRLETLRFLVLSDCAGVTDASIPLLAALPSLRRVDLRRTSVSENSCKELRRRRPALDVEY